MRCAGERERARDHDHDFFGEGPVVGFLVDDVELARAETEAAGIQFIGEIQRSGAQTWNHFRGPDGNVYEIISGSEVWHAGGRSHVRCLWVRRTGESLSGDEPQSRQRTRPVSRSAPLAQ